MRPEHSYKGFRTHMIVSNNQYDRLSVNKLKAELEGSSVSPLFDILNQKFYISIAYGLYVRLFEIVWGIGSQGIDCFLYLR